MTIHITRNWFTCQVSNTPFKTSIRCYRLDIVGYVLEKLGIAVKAKVLEDGKMTQVYLAKWSVRRWLNKNMENYSNDYRYQFIFISELVKMRLPKDKCRMKQLVGGERPVSSTSNVHTPSPEEVVRRQAYSNFSDEEYARMMAVIKPQPGKLTFLEQQLREYEEAVADRFFSEAEKQAAEEHAKLERRKHIHLDDEKYSHHVRIQEWYVGERAFISGERSGRTEPVEPKPVIHPKQPENEVTLANITLRPIPSPQTAVPTPEADALPIPVPMPIPMPSLSLPQQPSPKPPASPKSDPTSSAAKSESTPPPSDEDAVAVTPPEKDDTSDKKPKD